MIPSLLCLPSSYQRADPRPLSTCYRLVDNSGTEVVVAVEGSAPYVEEDECCNPEEAPSLEAQLDHICNKRLYKDEPHRDKKIGKKFSQNFLFHLPISYGKKSKIPMLINSPLSSVIHILCVSIHLR